MMYGFREFDQMHQLFEVNDFLAVFEEAGQVCRAKLDVACYM